KWSFSVLQRLSCVVMKIYVSGVEGGSVKIQCRYRADYIHRPKYFCRDPCGKQDDFKSVGKYSIYDDSPGRSFTVTIYKLTVRDSGIYYCAPDQWFIDTKTRINVSVNFKSMFCSCSSLTKAPVCSQDQSAGHQHQQLHMVHSSNIYRYRSQQCWWYTKNKSTLGCGESAFFP
uniref:Immunoglobulin domain-containing protein n=1 Tax=Denticeps clupeoides TaxID=299321 RepID=A0AAY4B951_9TELE